VVVWLSIVDARVLVAGGLPMRFLGRWCHIVVEDVGGFHALVVVGIGGVVSGYVTELGWCCFGGAVARTEAPASAPDVEGSR
jgi:hypothetical protein